MPHLQHVTLSTGHVLHADRRDVDDGALVIVGERLALALEAPGEVVVFPAPDPVGLSVTHDGRALIATFWAPLTEREAALADVGRKPWVALVTFGVAPRSTVGARLWPLVSAAAETVAEGTERPAAPWCAVITHPALHAYPRTAAWLGDAERVVAWAWIER